MSLNRIDTKISLLMKSLSEFYKQEEYINEILPIIEQKSVISLRILDWFITNYSKKYKTITNKGEREIDIYQNYKLQLKSYSKSQFDPFCRKNKIEFYYKDDKYIETSCGQLCFFRWCFENDILDYVKNNMATIEQDMKNSLKQKQTGKTKKKYVEPVNRSITKSNKKYIVRFD
jgi:hypothetical protein